MRNEACPIQVIQNCTSRIFGKRGIVLSPERLVKRDGMRTSAKKFRRCQSLPSLRVTRVDFFVPAPSAACRTTRVFFEKGIGTRSEPYKLVSTVQTYCHDEQRGIQGNASCTNAGGTEGFGPGRPARSFITNLQPRAGVAGLEASPRGGCVRAV